MIFGITEGVAVSQDSNTLMRIKGFAYVGMGLILWLLAKEGIRGVLRNMNLWRILVIGSGTACVLISGYRSCVLEIVGTVVVLFLLEGLHRTRMLLISLLVGLFAFTALYLSAPHLPYAFQRSISFLPGISVTRDARMEAESTVGWRWELWMEFAQDVPEYFWLGKGLTIRSEDMDWVPIMARYRENIQPWYASYLTGEHHNGLLSVLLSFGIFGLLCFLWFAGAVFWVLRQNMKYGDAEIVCINRLLFAFYIAYLLMFCTYFGTLYWQLRDITGIVGISVAINHGVCRRKLPPGRQGIAATVDD
jgi:O-antigen ligase